MRYYRYELPRDIDDDDLARRLGKYGYAVTRQSGSHLRLTSTRTGQEHHITIPQHKPLKIGTLNSILQEVATYLGRERRSIVDDLF
jgi:predicted RNA binding protein YcfA (HicA-like mRNA interferase family)